MEKMRRFKQELSTDEVERILNVNMYGILSLARENQAPYSLPMNYVYENGTLYVHGAVAGYKNNLLNDQSLGSFSVVDYHEPDEAKFSASFRSVILSGQVSLATDDDRKHQVLLSFCRKYFPNREDDWELEVEKRFKAVAVWELLVEEKRGKASMELVK